LTKDHLGSTAVITDKTGTAVVSEQFSALGWNENTSAQQATMANVTRHEFTGQEGLDNVHMVNMNGRVYIPSGSMFISPDPTIPDPTNTLSYNRYAYVNYNPLTFTDPTGWQGEGHDWNNCASAGSVECGNDNPNAGPPNPNVGCDANGENCFVNVPGQSPNPGNAMPNSPPESQPSTPSTPGTPSFSRIATCPESPAAPRESDTSLRQRDPHYVHAF
jgi:RHS repeat-associated protein